MSRLALFLLGPPRIECDGEAVHVPRRKAIALLAYLAVTGLCPGGQSHSRDALATLFWPESDQSRARASLRRALTSLRKAVGEGWADNKHPLDIDREMIRLNPDAEVWLDVAEFQDRLTKCQTHGHPLEEVCPTCLSLLTEAAALYRDDFLAGFTLRDSPAFDDWQFFQAQGLRDDLAGALERLAHGHSVQSEFERAIPCARRWVALDPLHEPAHRYLMQLYAWSDQRAAALRQYAECERVLQEELGVSPDEETAQLYQAIKENRELLPPEDRIVAPLLPVQPTPSSVVLDTLLNNRYRLDAEIGRGGMGTVYRAHDLLLERDVAVKVLSASVLSAESRARLLCEAQAAARLNHPNVVSVYDAGKARGIPFIVMELVGGESLHDHRPQALEEMVSMAQQVCDALEHAHAHGIVHRDLKPENVMIAPDGTAKLTDFGLVRTAASRLTAEGTIVGTPFYLAPEQALGGEIDHRADLYALGVVLYELTTGQLPFADDEALDVISQHLYAPVVPPRTHNATIPPALEALIVRLLSKQPEDRPASAAEVRQALDDLIRSEAPVKTRDGCPNNLPAQTTPFIGREAQLAAVRQELARPEVRLLTLTGTGGTGKTRLSLQVAAGLLDDADSPFEDGVFFIALAPIRDPTLVVPTIAGTLNVREVEGRPLLELLRDYLRDKHVLLVLDNFEQVTKVAPVVSDLLAAAPRLKVLVTSRASLRVYGEHDYPVPPLITPDPKELLPLEHLAQVEAVQLFIQRARAVKADFVITKENGPVVAEICQRLDGLPLAIELAAARVRLLPPQKMLAQLDNCLRFLTGGARDLPLRYQTLRGTIDWSYDLLDANEKTLFQRLAVFCSSCTLEAVEAVCNASGDLDTLNGLESLVDQSLLKPSDVNGEPRFGMLETIREYALEWLTDSGEAEAVRRQQAHFFVALAEDAEPKLEGAEQVAWLNQLEMEHDNLRTVLGWTLEREGADAELGLRLAVAARRFWRIRGYWTEGRRWLERALEKNSDASASVRAKALWAVGRRRENLEQAARLLQQSLTLYRQLEDKRGIARALSGLGDVANDFGQATALHEQSLALFQELGDKSGISGVLSSLGGTAWKQGNYGRATTLFEQSLMLVRETGNKWGIATRLRMLGNIALEQLDYGRAAALFEESLALARELGEKEGIAGLLNSLGEMARLQNDYERAATLYEEGLTLRRELGSREGIAMMLHNLGYVALHQGDGRQAAAFFKESLALYRELERKKGITLCLAGLAGVAGAEGRPRQAARLFGAVEVLLEATGTHLAGADRAEYDRNVAAVRAQLDETAFVAAWAAGQVMATGTAADALEQAIAHALGPNQ